MKRYLVIMLAWLALASIPRGGVAEKGQSIMFGEPDQLHQEQSRDTSAVELSKHCRELRRQMEELKDKPQRRHAVVQRYRLECQPPAN